MNWDLTRIYKNENLWEEDLKKLDSYILDLDDLKGKLGTKDGFLAYTKWVNDSGILLTKLYVYASMKNDLNQKDKESSRLIDRISSKYSEYVEKSSFADPEILSYGKDKILSYCKEVVPSFYHTMENLFRRNEHILDQKSEGLLASFNDASQTFNQLYSKLTIVDNKGVKVLLSTGEEVEINKANMTYYLSVCQNQEDRRKVFNAVYKFYDEHKNTLASILDFDNAV